MDFLLEKVESSMLESLVDEARFFVYAYNTTTLVTTAGLALGIFFIVTAIALYIYYYSSTTTGRRSGGEWEYEGNDYTSRYDQVADILGFLEKAFITYGVEQEECRRRLVCESHLPTAHLVNKDVSDTLSQLISQIHEEDLTQASFDDGVVVKSLQEAARRGLETQDCETYNQKCPHVALSNIVHNLR